MGQAFRKLFDAFFGNTEMRVPSAFFLRNSILRMNNFKFIIWDVLELIPLLCLIIRINGKMSSAATVDVALGVNLLLSSWVLVIIM